MATTLSKRYAHCATDFYKGMDNEGPYFEVKYKFDDWKDSNAIANEMLGKVTITGGYGGTVNRVVPHQHPLSPNLYCRGVRIEGLGQKITPSGSPVVDSFGGTVKYPDGTTVMGQDGMPYYTAGFLLHATYRPPTVQYQTADDPQYQQQIDPATPILWATQEIDWETETVTTPNNVSKWQSDGHSTGLPCRIQIGITVMNITFHQVPFMPLPKFRTLRGKTNSGVFLGAAQGTVLFLGGRTTRDFNSDGSVNQKVTVTFKERQYPWSQSLRPDTMAWDVITTDGSTPIYAVADFSPLVQF